MTAWRRYWSKLLIVLLLCFASNLQHSSAQTSQFLPEIDGYYKIQRDIRLDFQAKETREAGDPTQAEIGPSLDFFLKPLMRLKDVTQFDLDDAKSRPLQLSIGYRYVPSPNKPTVQRMIVAATPRLPLLAKVLLTDCNRADLDWSADQFTWRYRNKLTLERTVTMKSYHPIPCASAEAFFQSQYQKWSTTALYVGCVFPVGKHVQFDPYFEHQNLTGKRPNEQLNQLGLILKLYFRTGQ